MNQKTIDQFDASLLTHINPVISHLARNIEIVTESVGSQDLDDSPLGPQKRFFWFSFGG